MYERCNRSVGFGLQWNSFKKNRQVDQSGTMRIYSACHYRRFRYAISRTDAPVGRLTTNLSFSHSRAAPWTHYHMLSLNRNYRFLMTTSRTNERDLCYYSIPPHFSLLHSEELWLGYPFNFPAFSFIPLNYFDPSSKLLCWGTAPRHDPRMSDHVRHVKFGSIWQKF